MELQEKNGVLFCLIRLSELPGFYHGFLPEREGKQRDLCLYEP